MNDSRQRSRIIWGAGLGGVVILALLLLPQLFPSGGQNEASPVLRPLSTGSQAAGAEAEPAAEGPSGTGFSLGGGELVSLAWRLGLVALVIAGAVLALRWWGRKASSPRSITGFVRVIDTMALSNGRTLHLVALGGRVIVVGATTQQLTLLSELSEDESAEVLGEAETQDERSVGAFAEELMRSFRGGAPSRPVRRDSAIGGSL